MDCRSNAFLPGFELKIGKSFQKQKRVDLLVGIQEKTVFCYCFKSVVKCGVCSSASLHKNLLFVLAKKHSVICLVRVKRCANKAVVKFVEWNR